MMLLATSLPLLPPPSASLLPPLTAPSSDPAIQTQSSQSQQQHHRRQKHNAAHATRNNTLLALSTDERNISQRKMAIAMYGYSWLKPAGCAKTMLGRREEEVEREEVERQLREVELQERHAMEEAEQERIARRDELGEVEEGRDLDEDIPDAEGLEEEYESDEEGGLEEGDDEEGMAMGGDLDDEIPDADDQETEDEDQPLSPAGADGGWVYDTRREPDTDDEDQLPHPLPPPRYGARGQGRHAAVPRSAYDDDEREAEELANAMLNEDEMYDHGIQSSARRMLPHERDFDEDVPDAEDDQAWEHTDTELEESEMDISILPGQGFPQHGRSSGVSIPQARQPRRSSTRTSAAQRSSGPWIADPSPIPAPPHPHARSPAQTQIHTETQQATIPRQRRPQATLTPDIPPPSSNYFASTHRSASTRAARIVSGNRQRPYRPDIARATRHRLANQTPEMIDTPPLATAAAPQLNEDLEEVDTDIEGEEDESEEGGDVDVTTPDPFIAPEHARALGVDLPRPTGGLARGLPPAPMGLGRGLGLPPPTLGFEAPWGLRRARIGDRVAPEREAQARVAGVLVGNASRPSRLATTTAGGRLDGAAATLGVDEREEAGTGTGSQGQEGGARRTLFQRATRRRNPDAPTHGAEASGNGAGNSSGGLFSSPNPPDGGGTGENEAVGEWDTPESSTANAAEGESQEPTRRAGRRRSGRFLGGRRRGAE